MASEDAARFTGMLATRPIAIALTVDAMVRTEILVIVATMIGCDVCTADVSTRVSR